MLKYILYLFQYHTGSIQTGLEHNCTRTTQYFNTTLVLFKQEKPVFLCIVKFNFNTTLVLFKLYFPVFKVVFFKISIPHWFYSNSFQGCLSLESVLYFNTTLVLFKLPDSIASLSLCVISIPHWFYSNLIAYGSC